MTRRRRAFIAGALALAVVGAGAAYVTDVGPAPASDAGDADDPFPTETTASTDGGSGDTETSGGPATDAPDRPFAFVIDRIESCGNTCRDVTTTLTNQQSSDATSVTVHTRIFAGNGTDGDVVWQGSEEVGDLPAGESTTATKRVELSMMDGYAVKQNDGWISVQTTVQSEEETMTFAERRQVA